MSHPIPIEVIYSHIHLSEEHKKILFGERNSGTVRQETSQSGQFAYEETVDVVGSNGKVLTLRVLGPSRKSTQVELTRGEAELLAFHAPENVSGDFDLAADCTLKTENGEVAAMKSVIIPKMHIHLSDSEARTLRLEHGSIVRVDVIGNGARVIDDVIVRVHPTYRARMHMNVDDARDLWLSGGAHVRIRDLQH